MSALTVAHEVTYLEAEFAANAVYWADRAAAADRQKEAVREILAMKGETIKVVKGRKVPVGTEGVCFWVGENQYGWRVGFSTAEGETCWTALSNVEVVKAA